MLATKIENKKREDGFTLIELLVVVLIIGILAAIAIPAFLSQRERAWTAELTSNVRNAALEIEAEATNQASVPLQADLDAILAENTNPAETGINAFVELVLGAVPDEQGFNYTPDDPAFVLCGIDTRAGEDPADVIIVRYESDGGGIVDNSEVAEADRCSDDLTEYGLTAGT